MNLELSGQTVTRICFDYAVSLLLDAGVEIRIGTAFSLRTAGVGCWGSSPSM